MVAGCLQFHCLRNVDNSSVCIQEEGAIYWDDPDHLQAAPDRSIDEPEPPVATNSKSSLRAALNNTPNINAGMSTSMCVSP